MDGVREASAHTIVFQARAGTPELNCCSVNGPRVLGMLGEWASCPPPMAWCSIGSAPGSSARRWLMARRLVVNSSGDAWRDGQDRTAGATTAAAR